MVEAYLTSVVLPAAQGSMSVRNEQELKLLAQAVDAMLDGNMARALDMLILRFQAVEMSHADGHWQYARHLLPLREAGVSSTSRSLREGVLREERREIKSKAMSSSLAPLPR